MLPSNESMLAFFVLNSIFNFSSEEYFNLHPSNSASLYFNNDVNLSISLYI